MTARLHLVRPKEQPEWRFSILGRVRAWRSGREIDLGAPQQRALLAMLLLRDGAPATLDELTGGLWGENVPVAAVGTVRTYISRLRRLLCPEGPEELIISGSGGYRLRTDRVWLDFSRFRETVAEAATSIAQRHFADAAERLAAGLGLFDGIALAGTPGPYASAHRDRIEHLRGAAEEERIHADIALGRHATALADLSLRIAADPLRERLRELQMLALWRDGRQAEALSAFHRARAVLADELGVDPGAGLRRLHAEILAGDEPVRTRPRVAARIPAQVPAPPSDFTGRAGLVRRVAESLDQGTAIPVIGIAGLPGSGRTAVAAMIARRVAHRFPDGVLYADLSGAQTGARSETGGPSGTGARSGPGGPSGAGAVLAGWLRALGMADPDIPADLSEREGAWRTALAGRRILVVADDLTGGDALLRPLLPAAAGCAVLFTTDRVSTGTIGAEWHRLGPLATPEALGYLGRRIGAARVAAEPGAAVRLVESRSCLPSTLRGLAARLAARPAWTLADAERGLDADDDADEIYRRLDTVRETLGPAPSMVLAAIAAATGGTVSAGQIGGLLGMAEQDAVTALDVLAERLLIDARQPGRYRVGPLIHRYAALRRTTDVVHQLVAAA
ncbi:DNA-binding SARP family transcriptional activator [Catenuloplanes nepalensis]|uniref:DNA-binding SARP family transcriptional activator n=1 Tax=Catenuloplanes nepalensis TaxID=587533 RepID=A0ABT9MP66_9ACTN|nr:AfsR/SARP family transcriptional regulator [Catenuloplanes nepalensis]MDP9793209.1 DNA-binding SARP family transcriptional activator [Catenuloplanes nepalensis]